MTEFLRPVYHEMFIGNMKSKYIVQEPVIKVDNYQEIHHRIKKDNINIRKVCAKHLGSRNPWLPIKPNLNVNYYFLDKLKRLGWCVNAKVSMLYNIIASSREGNSAIHFDMTVV